MSLSLTISLPVSVQNQILSFASQYSVDGVVAAGIAQVISNGQQYDSNNNLLVTNYGVGVMGVSLSLASSYGLDATTENGNIQTGVQYLGQLLQIFQGNYPLALAAYVTSAATVQKFNGVPPLPISQNFVYNVSSLAAKAGSLSVTAQYALRNQTQGDPSGTPTAVATGINYGNSFSDKNGAQNTSALQESLTPQLQIDDPTLDNTAWYADTGLLTGNPRIRASVQPVSFKVFFDRNDAKQYLHNSTVTNGAQQPIEIQLNTSLNTFEIASKHVYNRTPSRTGMHITLWGMQPDLFSGTGTTGVFMNQFGLTDFFSVAQVSDDVKQLVTSGFSQSFKPNVSSGTNTSLETPNFSSNNSQSQINVVNGGQTPSGEVFVNSQSGSDTIFNNILNDQAIDNPAQAFRVAAQDAFVELLKLFQMNGSVYYYNQNYNGILDDNEQQSPNGWSSKVGASSFQQHARNNDVMTRGFVAMQYRNNVYLGYFKSLTWNQDAESPFQWKFNFTFQVERTYTSLYFPSQTVTQLGTGQTGPTQA